MQLLTVGISHHHASIDLREQLAVMPEQIVPALRELVLHEEIAEASILSTCNRTEIITSTTVEESTAPLEWFQQRFRHLRGALVPQLEIYRGIQAVRHLFQVAGGLDSMLVGEPQILGQVKHSYELARSAGTVGVLLNKAYQQSFSVGKQIRSSTAIGANPVSVAYAAVVLARQIFANLETKSALLIGAGDTVRLAARHLRAAGIDHLTVANRTISRAQELAGEFHGNAISLSMIPDMLAKADVVISSTNAELPILGKGALEQAIKKRRRRPMLLIDLAVPRDIEPEVAELEDVYLYTIDDLQNVVRMNLESRRAAVEEADRLIDAHLQAFGDWYNSQRIIPLLKAYRGTIDRTRDHELQQALAQLRRGQDPEAVISRLANSLTNKLAHAPSVALRQAGREGDGDALDALRRLFDLQVGDKT